MATDYWRSSIVAIAILVWSAHADARPIELSDYLQWTTATGPTISPNGRHVVYTVLQVDPVNDRRNSELWIMDSDGSNKRAIGKGWNARWSPDGSRLLYLSSGDNGTQILIREVDESGLSEPRPVTGDKVSPQSVTWSPDGTTLAFASTVDSPVTWDIPLPEAPDGAEWTAGPTIVDSLHFRSMSGMVTSYRRHLFLMDVATGKVRQLTSGDWYVGARWSSIFFGGAFVWSPDNRSIYFDGDIGFDDTIETMDRSNIYRVDVETGAIEQVSGAPGFWRTPSVSPDGKKLVFTGYAESPDTWAPRELRLIDIASEEESVLVDDLPDEVYRMRWRPGSDGIWVNQDREGSTNIELVTLDGIVRPVTGGMHRLYVGTVSNDGIAAASLTSPTSDYNVVRIDMSDGSISKLTDANEELLRQIDLGRMEEVWYQARDGQDVQGWIIYPPDFDPASKYPLILDIHGGPHYMAGTSFSFRLQEFAARGYLVLSTNPRGKHWLWIGVRQRNQQCVPRRNR